MVNRLFVKVEIVVFFAAFYFSCAYLLVDCSCAFLIYVHQISEQPLFVPGVWGPCLSAMVPGMWLNEGGQSATGRLVSALLSFMQDYTKQKRYQVDTTCVQSLFECTQKTHRRDSALCMKPKASLVLFEL